MENDMLDIDELDQEHDPSYAEDIPGIVYEVPSMEYLNQHDYALNSPLVSDELDEFSQYLWNDKISRRWRKPIWEKRRSALLHSGLQSKVLESEHIHKWIAKNNLKKNVITSNINRLMKDIEQDCRDTGIITQAFLRTWIGQDFPILSKTSLQPFILKWGQYFLEFHLLTLILNAANENEIKHISQNCTNVKFTSCKDIKYTIVHSDNFGKVIITEGFSLFTKENILVDRNIILMMKDMYAARFHSLSSLTNRYDEKFPEDAHYLLSEFYTAGDSIMEYLGNQAYEILKMIEPACNLKLTQLAREYRPKIPEFNSFKEHVENTITQLFNEYNINSTIFDIIQKERNVEMVLTYFGSFRHWGHPYIDYFGGLEKLYSQVTCPKQIDEDYANILASDLAYIVLHDQFRLKNKWMVELNSLSTEDPIYPFIEESIWPTPLFIENYGHRWHKLPLISCFEIPDMIDPSIIYSDKSHSMNRSEVINHIQNNPGTPIPTRKVLSTLLSKPSKNWNQFLKDLNDNGLDIEHLIIGLKEKEREIKIKGRFFSLMSWELRDYFVITEYLIKKHFVPLFYGLTMADDLTTVMRKMMESSNGQGLDNYDYISIANHIDYEKWNNHQRFKSTAPVFRVMGQFLGYPNLIERTHEFFEKSLIYHAGRGDLLTVYNGQVLNNSEKRVCWDGQAGGLEGLRQKGWSILNLLVIRREGTYRNTKIKCLAQGDNQVICTQYQLQKYRTDTELIHNINSVIKNNDVILKQIESGTTKLGLIINKDETMQSADFLSYGKVPVFRGNVRNLETKRWSRVTCVTNDQIPNLSNIMATVSTNALTVSHFSESPVNVFFHYNYLGNFARRVLEMHNPAMRQAVKQSLVNPAKLNSVYYKIATLYLDPSIGGVCGTSLTRFLIRQFPDPICESLTFLKMVYLGTSDVSIKNLMVLFAQPNFGKSNIFDFRKLIEDPTSLNIPRGINALTIIKEKIKANLYMSVGDIKNEIIRDSISYMASEEENLITFLSSIRPVFSRFISEYMSATFAGITNALVGLFQNSRTIRNVFSKKLSRELDHVIYKSELISYATLIKYQFSTKSILDVWSCSAKLADDLRMMSWGFEIIGATIPHPAELCGRVIKADGYCAACEMEDEGQLYISLVIPNGLIDYWDRRGPYPAYLGSRTSETTSLLQPWERECNVDFIERASRLRKAIGWMVDPDSLLAETIYQNLYSMTGENWDRVVSGFKRTGSALHRFSCSRQSAGGFSAQSPVKLTRIVTTTSTLQSIGTKNYDFMFQTCILFSQITAGEIHNNNPSPGYYHFHIGCYSCLREITEPMLETHMLYKHPDVKSLLSTWKPTNTPWSIQKQLPDIPLKDWDTISDYAKSFHIGRIEGFLFGDRINSKRSTVIEGSLFPLNLAWKVNASDYMEGILDGLIFAASLTVVFKWSLTYLKNPHAALAGTTIHLIDLLSQDNAVQNLWREGRFQSLFVSIPHKTPPSYPLGHRDLGEIGKNFLEWLLIKKQKMKLSPIPHAKEYWLFADVHDTKTAGLFGLAKYITPYLYTSHLDRTIRAIIRESKEIIIILRSDELQIQDLSLKKLITSIKYTDREVRHAAKSITSVWIDQDLTTDVVEEGWGEEFVAKVHTYKLNFIRNNKKPQEHMFVPRIQDPLISGLRLFQCATGSHYKVRAIIKSLELPVEDAISCGDGSGGVSSSILRSFPRARLIFNSLLNLDNVNLRGSNPAPPSAISMIQSASFRCVNLNTAWQNPSDLSEEATWKYFVSLKYKHHMRINLIVLDMEIQSDDIIYRIESLLAQYYGKLLDKNGCILYKTYLDRVLNKSSSLLEKIGSFFTVVQIHYTDLTSSSSSEVYISFQGPVGGQSLGLQPDWVQLRTASLNFPVFRSKQDEFKRALSTKKYDLLKGIPRNYLSDISIECTNFLMSVGVETGMAYTISQNMYRNRYDDSCTAGTAAFLMVANSLVNITAGRTLEIKIPSDNTVRNLGAITIGFAFWVSYILKDFNLKFVAQKMIDHSFPFSWSCCQEKPGELYYQHWSVGERLKVDKFLYLDNKMATIGQMIRIWRRMFVKATCAARISNVNKISQTINRGLTLSQFEKRTRLFQHIGNGNIRLGGQTETEGFEVGECAPEIPHWTD